MSRKVMVTGAAGFIGFHLSRLLLDQGITVVGVDSMTTYYDVSLKHARLAAISDHPQFHNEILDICDAQSLDRFVDVERPDVIVHLAAQAGVRYSLENPRSYIDTNVVGTFNIMECARRLQVDHLLMASTSSAYGANLAMPFKETEQADRPLTIYAATKKATESIGHSYAHLWNLPTTMFRFFTVYGPWGRPDMALFKFTKGILDGTPIDIYNNGDMFRDFTFVEDLVQAIRLLIDVPPTRPQRPSDIAVGDSLSTVAPFRIVNIGNSTQVRLMDYISEIELALGKTAVRNYMDMQVGDVPATWADTSLLHTLTGYRPSTPIREGIQRFVSWYRSYYGAEQ
jgi:UDP-glucuronate 4-epimerase